MAVENSSISNNSTNTSSSSSNITNKNNNNDNDLTNNSNNSNTKSNNNNKTIENNDELKGSNDNDEENMAIDGEEREEESAKNENLHPPNSTTKSNECPSSQNELRKESVDTVMSDSSPSKSSEALHLRRSQRASAKRAQERLRGEIKDDFSVSYGAPKKPEIVEPVKPPVVPEVSEPPEKIRRLVDPTKIDASDPHFAVQMIDSGAVVLLSDESDVSSLHTNEVDFLKKNFDKLKCKELTEEQLIERDRMIQELKTHLRIEEARLSLVKKMRQVQKLTQKEPAIHPPNVNTHTVPQNHAALMPRGQQALSGVLPRPPAYRPPVATLPQLSKIPATAPNAQKQSSMSHAGTPSSVVRSSTHVGTGVGAHSTPLAAMNSALNLHKHASPLAQHQQQQQQGAALNRNHPHHDSHHVTTSGSRSRDAMGVGGGQSSHNQSASSLNAAAVAMATAAAQSAAYSSDTQTPAQRQAAAKLALRKQLEKTLLQIPPPKPPPAELHFVPNPNQPDFLYLVGLDEIVERLLLNKEMHLIQKQKHQQSAQTAPNADTHLGAGAVTVHGQLTSSTNNNENNEPIGGKKLTSKTSNRTLLASLSVRKRNLDNVEKKPYACAQCGTDYTPVWKSGLGACAEKAASQATKDRDNTTTTNGMTSAKVMCEQCVRSNQKKALKAEHMNLLRQKFEQALQQEKEIERQIKDGTFHFPPIVPAQVTVQQTMAGNVGGGGQNVHQSSVSSSSNARSAQMTNQKQQQHHHHQQQQQNIANQQKSMGQAAAAASVVASVAAAASGAVPSGAGSAPNVFGAMNFSPMAAAQMLGVGWNPLLATARFPPAATAMALANQLGRQNWQAALAAAVGAQTSAPNQQTPSSGGGTTSAPSTAGNLTAKELLKNFQQLQQQQQQQMQMQRQFYLDMMPRTQKWK